MEWEKKHSSLKSRHSKTTVFVLLQVIQLSLFLINSFIFKINIKSFQFDDLSIFYTLW